MADLHNVFKELSNLNKEDLSIDGIIDSMSEFSMEDLHFMQDCIDLMIIYREHNKEKSA